MKVLIYGHKGWIGSQFVEILKSKKINFKLGVERADSNIENEIDNAGPSHVISFIGRTHGKIEDKEYTTIDYLEQKGKLVENVRDNLYAPINIAFICKKKNIHYTYLGTGCIFKYDDDHPCGLEENGFKEESLPNFFGSSYSVVKGFTDRLMNNFDNVLNLRIRMPITNSYNPRNFITKITNYEHICSIPNSMSVLPELLPLVVDMMTNSKTGTINLTNPGLISHNEILQMYKEIVDPNFTWKNFSKEEQSKILASDRSNNFLDTNSLAGSYKINNIKLAVKKCLYEYKNSMINLLVTGGCGFIGSNFINYIFKKYPYMKIINIDAMYYSANENNIDEDIRNSSRYTLYKVNTQNSNQISNILNNHHINYVINFAAQSHVDNSFDDSIQYSNDNILGTHTLLEECKKYNKIEKFVHISTDEVYGESMIDDSEEKTENSILCPTNPYAATKGAAEMLVQSYYHSFKLPVIITRGNNVYGFNQYPEKLIPKFIQLLKQRRKLTIQGDGSVVRSFLFVTDVARALELVLVKGKIGEIYNIGGNENSEYSVMDITKKLIKKIVKSEKYDDHITFVKDRPFNDKRYFISNQKIKDLGWEQTINLDKGLELLL